MSNSPLVSYTRPAKYKGERTHEIDTVSIHCYVGQVTAKQGCDYFATINRKASSNYVVGFDGSIGLSVEEKYRSMCTSSTSNDNRAITIEVASETTRPYKVTDKAYSALIDLLVDICKRNPKIGFLKWEANKSLIGKVDKQNMTVHRWFDAKDCPGDYLYNLHSDIVKKVNARLEGVKEEEKPPVKEEIVKTSIEKGDIVKIASDATYYNGTKVPNWVKRQNWIVKKDPVGDKVIIDKNVAGTNSINSPISSKYLTVVESPFKPYMVRVTISNLNMRTGASTSHDRIDYIPQGVYTIVEESGKWGRLKSKQTYKGKLVDAWIHLDYAKKL